MRNQNLRRVAIALGVVLLVPGEARAAVTLSATSIDFGEILLGTHKRVVLTLTNTSPAVNVNAITSTDGRFAVCPGTTPETATCSAPGSWGNLGASSTLDVLVEFTPSALGPNPVPPATAKVTVDTDDGVQEVDVKGKAIAIDLVLLFDNSGSMQWLPDGTDKGGPIPLDPGSRMQLAKNAASEFVTLMSGLPGIANVRVGVCLFNTTGTPPDGCVRSLTAFDLGALNSVIIGSDVNQVRIVWDGTQMGRGLTVAKGMLTSAANRRRAIVMLSNGAHNQGLAPEGVLGAADGIPLYALGYGNMRDVDPGRLRSLVDTSGNPVVAGFRHFDPVGCPAGVTAEECLTTSKQLDGFLVSIMNGLGLIHPAIDPAATIAVGQTQLHDVQVVDLDRTAQFVVSAEKNFPPGLTFDLLDPQGQVVDAALARQDPDVVALPGPRYVIYRVREGYLRRAGKLGTWKMRVQYRTVIPDLTHAVAPQLPFTYSYSALMVSGLQLSVAFDRPVYGTGDPILLTASVTANGRRLTGAAIDGIQVPLDRPQQGIGTWHALNAAQPAWVDAIPAVRSGEPLSAVQRKGLAVSLVGGIGLPGRAPVPPLVLHDDGKDGDAVAGDGVYSARFTDTSKPDTYTFHVVASGKTPGGRAFTREALVQQLVSVNVVPSGSSSPLTFQNLGTTAGATKVRVQVVPKDRFGNYLGPGYLDALSFQTTAGSWLGPAEEDLRGGYTRTMEFRRTTQNPDVIVAVADKSFPPQDVKWRLQPRILLELFAGRFIFASGIPVDDGLVLGVRAGTPFPYGLHLEGELGWTRTKDAGGVDGNVLQGIASVRWDVDRLSLGPVVPFLIAGGGWLGFTGFESTDSSGVVSYGLGVTSELGTRARVRVDARELLGLSTYGERTRNHQATASVAFGF